VNNKIIIFGNGSMSRVLTSFVGKENIVAYCADDEFINSDKFLGMPLIKFSQMIDYTYTEGHSILMALGYHNMNANRKDRFERLSDVGYKFGYYINDYVISHDDVLINDGVVIYDNVAIHTGSRIGKNVFISSNVSIGHDCDIGNHAWINSGVSLAGGVKVGERCVFGINSCVAQGVKLGEGTFIGANTLVTKDTKPNSVVISSRNEIVDIDSTRFLKLARQP